MKNKKFIYVIFKIPVREDASPQRVRETLHSAMAYLEFSEEDKMILKEQNTHIRQLVLPTFGKETEVITIFPEVLDDHMKKKMEDNVMHIQDYLKKFNNYE